LTKDTKETDDGIVDVGIGAADVVTSKSDMLTENQARQYFLTHNQQTMTNISSNINVNEFVRGSEKKEDSFWKRIGIEISLNFVNPERFYIYVKAFALIGLVIFIFVKIKLPTLSFEKKDIETYLQLIYGSKKS